MIPAVQLGLFFLLVLGIVALPGLDMAYVLGSSLSGGRRGGLAAVAGIMAGGACHVLLTGLGVGALLQWSPVLFQAVLWIGAGYVAWIGYGMWRSEGGALHAVEVAGQSRWTTFRRGAVTCLLNPKAYLFTLAVFPQFLRGGGAAVAPQVLAMAAITSATQVAVYGSLAVAAGRARQWLRGNPATQRGLGRGVGAMLVLAAAWTAAHGLLQP